MPPQPQPSIKALVGRTVADAQRLAKAQVALLQAEMAQTGGKIGMGSVLGLVTAALAFFAALFLLLTLAFVIVALGLPIWAGMLIVAALMKAEFEKTRAALSGEPARPLGSEVRPNPSLGS
jgi:membrane glycosyltransferase